jgi:ribosomal protein S18
MLAFNLDELLNEEEKNKNLEKTESKNKQKSSLNSNSSPENDFSNQLKIKRFLTKSAEIRWKRN